MKAKIGQLWSYSFKETKEDICVVVEERWNKFHDVPMYKMASMSNPDNPGPFCFLGSPCWKLYKDVC